MNEIEKQLYTKLIEPCKEFIVDDIKSVLLLNRLLPEDILWVISNELFDEIKKEPIYSFYSENEYYSQVYIENSIYEWSDNYVRTKYNLPTKIDFSYIYPFDGFYNYKNIDKKTGHNIESIIDIDIQIEYTNKNVSLLYEHNNSNILDVNNILNNSKIQFL